MKKVYALILIAISLSVNAQWELITQVQPILNDVQCITENNVIVVGGNGLIMKTVDGGIHWNSQSIGNSHYLKKVQFKNELVGYILGLDGIGTNIFKTFDGGENWTSILSSDLPDISDFSCVNQDIIYVTFEDGSLKKSINGGVTFETIKNDIGISNLQFITEDIGYACDGVTIFKTINGGVNWIEIFHVQQPTFDSAVFHFVNENVGFINWQNDLFRTTNGGNTFSYLSSVDSLMLKLFAPSENILWGMSVEVPFQDVSVLTMRGEIIENGNFEKVQGLPQFRSMHFINPSLGFGVNNGGEIYKNTTGLLNLNSSQIESKIKIFPNPTIDLLNVVAEENSTLEINLYNCLGNVLYKKNFELENDIQLDVKSYSKGVYILEIKTDYKTYREKIIIK